jgi:hypothetical protein
MLKIYMIKKPRPPCYIVKQRFKGLDYTLGLGREKTKNGEFTKVVMNDNNERSLKNAWRFVIENDRTFSCKYKIQNCETKEILNVSYKKPFKSGKVKNVKGYPDPDDLDNDNESIMEVEVYVVKAEVDDGFSHDDIQTWRVHEQSDNKILISDASKPTYYLGADSNGGIY